LVSGHKCPNLINLAQDGMLIGGYFVNAVPLATAIVGGISTGAWPVVTGAAAKLVPLQQHS
jgi:hypothetical protein